jgi:DNA-binding NarL/FixJ family response regulator
MISVLLVDDHAYVLKALLYLLEATEDIQVVATASSGLEAVTHAGSDCPHVLVIDVSMPLMNGIEATRQILLLCPLTRVMMLSIFDTPEYIHRALDVGALGYVLKDEASKDLLTGIRALSTGSHFFSQQIAGIAEMYLHQKGNDGSAV